MWNEMNRTLNTQQDENTTFFLPHTENLVVHNVQLALVQPYTSSFSMLHNKKKTDPVTSSMSGEMKLETDTLPSNKSNEKA